MLTFAPGSVEFYNDPNLYSDTPARYPQEWSSLLGAASNISYSEKQENIWSETWAAASQGIWKGVANIPPDIANLSANAISWGLELFDLPTTTSRFPTLSYRNEVEAEVAQGTQRLFEVGTVAGGIFRVGLKGVAGTATTGGANVVPNSATAAERSASFQGAHPYEGVDSLRNIELSQGKRIAHVTFREDGRPVSEYFTTESAIRRATLPDGTIDANRLNQGLQIYPGVDEVTGLQRADFKPFVQFFETTETIPMGQAAFGRTLANPVLNPGGYPSLPQLFINKEYHQFLKPADIQRTTNTAAPFYTWPKGD